MKTEHPLIEQYELVKEIHYVFDNIEPKIKARIYKVITGPNAKYTWELNNYCKVSGEADVYIPGAPFADSQQEIEHKLSLYVKRFEKSIALKVNDYF